jgi:hypothetical protein
MNIVPKILFAGGLLLASNLCWAQHRLLANVPFDFTTAAGRLPAGHYDIVSGVGGNKNVAVLRHAESQKSVIVLSSAAVDSREASSTDRARLIFVCGDSGCSLSEIWPGYGVNGQTFPQPQKRRELKTQVATVTVPATNTIASAKPHRGIE